MVLQRRARRANRWAICALLVAGSTLINFAVLADGDAAAGHNLFSARCAACHSLAPTRKPGPLLTGVYGRRAGSLPGYHYSTALRGASITWNESTLDRWLTGPPAYIPGVNMLARVDSEQDRQNLVAYLKSLKTQTANGTKVTGNR
jgi:cytochrome c2